MTRAATDFEAIGLAVAGFTLWVLTDSTMKWIGRYGLPAYEVVAFLGLFICVCLAAYAAARREVRLLRPANVRHQAVRSCLDLANNLGVVIAVRHLPLTLFYILIFSAPMVVAILAAVFLKERINTKKAVALLAGFAGVVIAVNPFGGSEAGDWVGYGACMVCVACFSVSMVWSRVLTRTETPESLTFFSGALMAVAGFGAMVIHAAGLSAPVVAELFLMGVFCAGGSICFFLAIKHTSASNVSQYHYTQLLTGALISYLVWREAPTAWMVLGGALIVASGLYIAWLAARGGGLTEEVLEHPL
jgi:drug/metabolite transporter (DMT)-like permease